MIEFYLPAPTGYVAHRLIVPELDLECDPTEPINKYPKHCDSTFAHIRKAVGDMPSGHRFTSFDLIDFDPKRLSAHLPRLTKGANAILRRLPQRKRAPSGKQLFIYERI